MTVARLALALIGCGLGLAVVLHAGRSLHGEILGLKSAQAALSGDPVSARAYASRALQLRPQHYPALERVALADERLGLARRAIAHWDRAVALRPSWPYAWAYFARSQLRQSGDPRAAAAALARVQHLGDHERGIWKLLGLAALEPNNRSLDPPLRDFLDERLAREASVAGMQLVGYVLVRRREEVLCEVLSRGQPEPWWCDEARKGRMVCDQPVLAVSQEKHCAEAMRKWRSMQYP